LISFYLIADPLSEQRDPTAVSPPRAWVRRMRVVGAIVLVAFLVGVSVGVLALSSWVTPNVTLTGPFAGRLALDSPCNGWPQISSDGYFHCSMSIRCTQGDSSLGLTSASAPLASNLIVSPTLPLIIPCGPAQSLRVSGVLGYTAAVEIDLAT
jgi:hypothetical protein